MFLPRPKDEDMNRGAANESKIRQDHHSMSMTTQTNDKHLLHGLMIKSNGQSNDNE